MVGVAVEEHSGREGAQGVVLALSVGVAQEFEVVDAASSVVEAVGIVVLEQISGDDNLVEEVPLAVVGEGSDSVVEHFPPGVVESVGLDVVLVFGGSEHLGDGDVIGVVVKVAHNDYALVGADGPQRVGDMLRERGGRFAEI